MGVRAVFGPLAPHHQMPLEADRLAQKAESGKPEALRLHLHVGAAHRRVAARRVQDRLASAVAEVRSGSGERRD